jgi:hypothetical protein
MEQAISQALSGFSIVLFTLITAVVLLVFTGAVLGGVFIGTVHASRYMRKQMLTATLKSGVITKAKREKPTIVKAFKKEAKG